MNKALITALILLPFLTTAQVTSDAKFWSAISISKKVNDFKLSFSEELRFDENVSHIDKIFSELGVQYKIIKGLYVGVNYRFNKDNDYESRNYDLLHRIDLGLTYKYKLKKIRLSFRTKIQRTSANPEENSPLLSRNKFTLKYKFNKKIMPFASYEFYYQFNDQKVINRTRISLGTSYKMNKKSSIKLFYIFENRFNVKTLKRNHIYGVSYSLDL